MSLRVISGAANQVKAGLKEGGRAEKKAEGLHQ